MEPLQAMAQGFRAETQRESHFGAKSFAVLQSVFDPFHGEFAPAARRRRIPIEAMATTLALDSILRS